MLRGIWLQPAPVDSKNINTAAASTSTTAIKTSFNTTPYKEQQYTMNFGTHFTALLFVLCIRFCRQTRQHVWSVFVMESISFSPINIFDDLLQTTTGMDYQGDQVGGGGYSQNNTGGGFGSQGTPEKKRRSYDEQTLIPINLDMACKATTNPEGDLTLEDGRPLHTVKLIAAVREVEEQSTCVVWKLEDCTGYLEAKQWVDDNDPSIMTEMRKEAAQDCIYVKVIGQLKEFQGVKTLMINSICPIVTGNQLTHHFLEVMYSAEKFKRADSIVPPVMPLHNTLGGGLNSGSVAAMGGGETNDAKQRVMQIMQMHSSESEEGVNIALCFQAMPEVSQADIRKYVNELAEEGSIYSTINEDFFKAAE
jgi:replication factor A2